MIEFGRVMMALEMLNNAARNGARMAVISGSTTASAKQAISDTLANTTITGASTSIAVNGDTSVDVSNASPGDTITVTITVPASNVSWLPVAVFTGNKTLGNTVVMRHE
jgi:Flp pilus assembly protein TadG